MASEKLRVAIVDMVRDGTIDAIFQDDKGGFVSVRFDESALVSAGIRAISNELFLYDAESGKVKPYAPAFEQEAQRLLSWADTY